MPTMERYAVRLIKRTIKENQRVIDASAPGQMMVASFLESQNAMLAKAVALLAMKS